MIGAIMIMLLSKLDKSGGWGGGGGGGGMILQE